MAYGDRVYGANYSPDLSIKEIATIMRKKLKEQYGKRFKWSVRSDITSINIYLVEIRDNTPALKEQWLKNHSERLQAENYLMHPKEYLSSELNDVLTWADQTLNSYNYDGSIIQIDYIDVYFYGYAQLKFDLREELYRKAKEIIDLEVESRK